MLNKLTMLMTHTQRKGVFNRLANPASCPGGFGQQSRLQVWSEDQIARMIAAAGDDIRVAVALLLYTAQRPSDVLAMDWSRVETHVYGRVWTWLVQQKTGALVDIRAHRDLERAPLTIPEEERTGLLLKFPRGKPWSYRNFARSWDRIRRRADYRLARELLAGGVGREDIRKQLIPAS
jgi:integrase